MRKENGITMIALVIAVIVLSIISAITFYSGRAMVKEANLQNLKTNMLLIKAKAKEVVENANFEWGTGESPKDASQVEYQLTEGGYLGEIVDNVTSIDNYGSMNNLSIDKNNGIYCVEVKLDKLEKYGITGIDSSKDDYLFIIKYDVLNCEVEVYITKGFNKDGVIVYSLSDLED